ncbi:transcriptional regulator with XRE-family HTH domain [Variovorax sp. TBS-050B]|nr:transcriptional regulator with XRE-family HTH domain [Variovorax sp. TBS-050B]
MNRTPENLRDGPSPMREQPALVDSAGSLGPYVKAVRKEQRLRIDDAAGLFGVSVDTLSRLENGIGAVRLDKLLAVLDGLGLAMLVGPKEALTGLARDPGGAAR